MPGTIDANETAPSPDAAALPRHRLVLVDEPQRLIREALVAAVDAVPGLSAMDGSAVSLAAADVADAAVVAARSLRFGWHALLDRPEGSHRLSPVVVVADHGPVIPSDDGRGLVVVSRETPLSAIVDVLRADWTDPATMPRWDGLSAANGRGLTSRERQVLGLLASGLSPAEVARALAITMYTVRDHIKAIREKLDSPTMTAAILEAIRRGLIEVDPL
jgi:DNA-binding CsgD family transcriptional regulator